MSFGQAPRQMFDVDATCAQCGTHISQLPFQPSGDRPVYCSDCNRKYRDTNRSGNRSSAPRAPRQMFDVDVNCGQCGVHITQLPFQPSGDRPVYCKDCMMARRAA
ncbi:MAG TPA: CxxC-x17-CxxC domain-containing protein [Candidatus Kapabacteria bacterium]|nr:CxxC-x17-CxxC domain-containing protein [Candidatus Kapabacteria bacterium]